ncbi:MAG: hypothetical protein ABL935_04855, partial [Nitrospiraceae bacterium]
LYTFTLTQPTLISFEATPTNFSLGYTLTNSVGQTFASDPFFSTPLVISLQPGTYTFAISEGGFTKFGFTGNYQLKAVDLVASATPLTPGTPVTFTFNTTNTTVYYKFNATANQRFFFDGGAAIFAPNGGQLFDNGQGEGIQLPQTGTYLVRLQGSPGQTVTFDAHLIVDDIAALSLNTLTNGSIAHAGQKDFYTFTLTEASSLLFDALSNNFSHSWSLTGPRGVEVNNRLFNQDTNQPILNLVPGSYTLTVDASGNTTGGYSFRLHNLATGTSVTPGTVVNGTLSPGNRTEIHKLAVNAGDRFTFDAQTSSGGSLSWRLINPYGRQVFGPGNFTDVANQTLNTPGQYTLVIEGNAANTANVSYNFNVQFLGNTPPPPVVGTPLTFDTTTSGTISTPNAVVRYTFNVPTQRVLYLDTLTNNSNIFWTLRGPAGDEMANLNSFVAQDVRLLVAGDYVLEVTSPFANSFSFRLDDLNTAPVLTLGTPVSNAQLSPPNRTDAYR